MRFLLLLPFLASCGVPYGGACEDLVAQTCDLCDQESDYEDLLCKCFENGTLTKNDAPDGTFDTDDDAAMYCSETLYSLQYPSPDSAAYCRQEVAMFDEYGKDNCSESYDYTSYYSY